MNGYIDLHMHSKNSDGLFDVQKIVNILNENNNKIISITDHDNIDSVDILKHLSRKFTDMYFIPGAEFTTDYCLDGKNVRIHILAHGIDDSNGILKKEFNQKTYIREEGNKNYVEFFLKKFSFVNREEFSEFDYTKYALLKKLILRHIDIKKYTEAQQSMILKCLNEIEPIYRNWTFKTNEAIDLIKENGGLATFAHPYQTGLNNNELDRLTGLLVKQGIDGIETHYLRASKLDNLYAKYLSEKYNLLESCGTDFHGDEPYRSMDIKEISIVKELFNKEKFVHYEPNKNIVDEKWKNNIKKERIL